MEEVKLHRIISLIPPAYFELASLKEQTGSYTYYQVRHPAGIFSINLQDAVTALNILFLEVNNAQAKKGPLSEEEEESLKKLTTDFLFKLINYFECGYEVFLAYSPEDIKPTEKEPLHKWFSGKGNADKIAKYYEKVNPFLENYRRFFNGLKHSSNQISIFHFFKENTEDRIIGFYLEGVDASGAICPVERLHPKYKAERTAWSYNFHLRIFYFLIYKIAEEIENVVKDLCLLDQPGTQDLLVPIGLETECSKAFQSARRFDGAFNIFFPQEVEEITKTIGLENNDLKFSDHKPTNLTTKGTGYRAVLRSRSDGFSRTWGFLYMSDNEKKIEDENGNCRNCNHSLSLHQPMPHDRSNLKAGGVLKCNVMGCLCKLPIIFNVGL